MAMFEGPSLDDVTDHDWTAYAVGLADRIASVGTGAEILVSPDSHGEDTTAVAMLVRKTSRGTVLCALSGTGSPPPPWMREGDFHTLEDDEAWVDRFVSTLVTHIRTVWNVPHPSFLAGDGDTARRDVRVDLSSDVVRQTEAELAESVESAVRAIPDSDVRTSGDGSYCVTIGTIAAYVYVASDDEVRVHVPVVERIAGRTRAAEVVSDLNRRHPRLKFLLVEDRVHAASSVDAHPFVAQHTINAVLRVVTFAASVDDAFAYNLGGVVAAVHPSGVDRDEGAAVREDDESDTDCDVPAQLMTLLEIDAQSGGAVAADDVVAVCGADRAKIARYESFCLDQALSWREFARDAIGRGDSEMAAECESEAVPWDRIVIALRNALRAVGYLDNA